MSTEKWRKVIRYVLFPLILLLYPLIHYNIGVDITDTGYSLGGFLYPNQMGEEWVSFSMYLANAVGRLLTNLPYGRTLMGMNVYTGLFVSATALFSYFFFCGKVPTWIAFLGEFLAISLCWCPTIILYNYLTYFFFVLAVLFLYMGLTKEKQVWLLAAGVVLGWNVMTRFPNITETALILVVWYYGWLHRKKIGVVIRESFVCVGGFLAGIGSILAVLAVRGEFASYFKMIESLFAFGTDTQSGHSITDMLRSVVDAYAVGGKWFFFILLAVLAGFFLFWIGRERFQRAKQVCFIAVILLLLRFLYGRGMYNFDYHEIYGAVFQWVVIFLLLSLIVDVSVLAGKSTKQEEKLLAAFSLLIILVTPLGSDNYLNQNINNLFLVAPLTFYWSYRFLRHKCKWKLHGVCLSAYPLKAMLAAVLAVILLQSALFGFTFVFGDGKLGVKRDTQISENAVLKGMYTSKEKAEALESITVFCKEQELFGSKVVLFGRIPAMSCFLDMPPALSTTWADLPSYQVATMRQDITDLEQAANAQDRPVILLNVNIGAWLSEDAERMSYFGVVPESYEQDEKVGLIRELIRENGYAETFANSAFVLYE